MIVYDDVSKSFGPKRVLDGLSFSVEPGRVVGFVGANGAGKSTALKALLGILRVDGGSVSIDGRPAGSDAAVGRLVGSFLGPGTIPNEMTGTSYLQYLCRLAGLDQREIPARLAEVGLSDAAGRRAGGYSLGMRMRLGIAGALLGTPKYLVLDEPVNGLDVDGVHWMRQCLLSAARSGQGVLLSSHLLSELELIADDVVMLRNGRTAVAGTLDEVRGTVMQGVAVHSRDDQRLAAVLTDAGGSVTINPQRIEVRGLSMNQVARVCGSQDIELLSITSAANLEDIYLQGEAGRQDGVGQPVPQHGQGAHA